MKLLAKLRQYLMKRAYMQQIKMIDRTDSLSTIYDIGAHKGRWSKAHSKWLPNSTFVMFEANIEHEKKLKSRGFRYFIGVLTSHGGSVRFYKKAATGDSIFRENTTHYIEADYVEMPSRRLSELVKEHNLKMPDFIKIDVQGAEIEVMNGGLEVIQHAKAILLECPVT